MLIGIDARELCGKPTGVGRYLNGLLSEWASLPEARSHRFLLFAPEVPAVPLPSLFELRILSDGAGTRWEQFTLARAVKRSSADVLFSPAYSAPLIVSAPIVLAMHDISFVVHPEWFRWRERIRRTWLARRSAQKATRVLADTTCGLREIVAHLGVPSSRICVIPPGVTVPGAAARTERPDDRAREPIVLFAGSIFNRRHLPDLIRAFTSVARRHPEARLEIVGENRTHPHEDLETMVNDQGLQNRVRLRSYESDEVLGDLYRKALVFAFLSEYEGFGLPPLEALASGVPAVLADTPVAREVCGDAARYVSLGNIDGLAQSLEALLFDSRARQAILDRAPAVLARYSWDRAARATLAALEDAAQQTAGRRRPAAGREQPGDL